MPEQGGVPYDAQGFAHGVLRAELCNLANEHFFSRESSSLVDKILDQYDVTKKPIKETVS